jgi:hypothetical protein
MGLLTSKVWSGIALIAVLCLTASRANAQHGTFNLPFEARWGTVVLPPGSYQFSIHTQVSWPRIIEVSGNGKTVSISAGIEASQPQSDHSYLLLSSIDGAQVVREFSLGASGKAFTFLPPKTIKQQLADLGKARTTRLPIGTSRQ